MCALNFPSGSEAKNDPKPVQKAALPEAPNKGLGRFDPPRQTLDPSYT